MAQSSSIYATNSIVIKCYFQYQNISFVINILILSASALSIFKETHTETLLFYLQNILVAYIYFHIGFGSEKAFPKDRKVSERNRDDVFRNEQEEQLIRIRGKAPDISWHRSLYDPVMPRWNASTMCEGVSSKKRVHRRSCRQIIVLESVTARYCSHSRIANILDGRATWNTKREGTLLLIMRSDPWERFPFPDVRGRVNIFIGTRPFPISRARSTARLWSSLSRTDDKSE